MTVVRTGYTGHVGGNLVRVLLNRGRTVRVLIHCDRRAIGGLEMEWYEGDVRDPISLRRAFTGAEIVYHAATHISLRTDEWPPLETTNVMGTHNVVAACLACGVRRLIHFSSIHAMVQEPLELPVDECRPLAGLNGSLPYDRSKAESKRGC